MTITLNQKLEDLLKRRLSAATLSTDVETGREVVGGFADDIDIVTCTCCAHSSKSIGLTCIFSLLLKLMRFLSKYLHGELSDSISLRCS